MAPQTSTIIFFFSFFSVFLPFAAPLSFNFSKFDQNSLNFIDLQGDAFFNQVIQLTKNQLGVTITNSTGRAVYKEPLLLWDSDTGEVTDFMTHFSFVINAFNNSLYGDGLTFFLAPYPSVLPDDSSGGNLGLLSRSSSFNALRDNFVAVEFDTFKNTWDPNSDHVGINVNSVVSVADKMWNSSIKDGRTANAWVWYNANTQNLSVFLTYKDNPVFNWSLSLSYVVDMKKFLPEKVAIGFSGATGYATEIHNLLSWQFSSNLMAKKKSKVGGLVVGLVVSIGVAIVVLGLVWFIFWRRKTKKQGKEDKFEYDVTLDNEFESGRGPKRFLFSELFDATKNFSKDLKLGEGGFGEVYKGVLTESKIEVAIKRVSAGSKQGKKEYMSEVKIISRLRHRNLVQLVGWCHEHGEFLLIYEFMPNGSLDTHLYNQKFLAWPVRYKIALGIASALLYLHEEWEQCVVHRDIKPSNVMLDSSFNAKLGDFGLARLVDHDIGSQTTILAGTMGYLAPESVTTGRASKESDVYSFGVVALEIACGRKAVDLKEKLERVKLVQWVWDLYGQRMIFEAADERLKMDFEEKEMERLMVIGLWCAHPDHNLRPSIRQVINVLQFEAPLPYLPPKMPVPMYLPPLDLNNLTFTSSTGASSGTNTTSTKDSTNSSKSAISSNSSSGGYLLK